VNNRKALLLVFDGLGFNRDSATAVVDAAWRKLPHGIADQLLAHARNVPGRPPATPIELLARRALYPVHAEALAADVPYDDAIQALVAMRAVGERAARARSDALTVVRAVARERRYAPWAAATPFLNSLRNEGVTWPTSAAGVWAGFEELYPPVQGNSDTGHQQIGNLAVAPQTPLEIARTIEAGAFFRNEALTATLDETGRSGGAVNFCFLLSGTRGGDGRVHSAWNHLEAFLKLVFEVHKFSPARVRMQAILDGRDSPGDSSIVERDGAGDYLGRLEQLLGRYDAVESLAWVIGRNVAMDRDYREPDARADYLQLTRAEGRAVRGFVEVRAAVEETHRAGNGDGAVVPLIVLDRAGSARKVASGDAFVNLQFRADRQRAKTGAMLGARDFLAETAGAHGKEWKLDWLDDSLRLGVCTIADYHPRFEQLGARVAFPNHPHADNFLALFPALLPGERYLLAGESVKSAHVGFFIRGRRESPVQPGVEDREIVTSCGEAEGVSSDADFHKTPAMRNREIAELIAGRLGEGYRLIVANFSNCDMIGHLLPERFDAALKACEALDAVLQIVIPAARSAGYDVVLTSDHGNIEDDTTAHTTNDVLTTVLPAGQGPKLQPARRHAYQARLFDIPWTLGRLFGVEEAMEEALRARSSAPSFGPEDQFRGHPLIAPL
jgi:2,3-bisphosphoglycerate-independent phosphoglycerate mutase